MIDKVYWLCRDAGYNTVNEWWNIDGTVLKKFTGALIKLITRLKIFYKGLKNLLQDVSVAFATLFTQFFFF